jgi:hypothetical protein
MWGKKRRDDDVPGDLAGQVDWSAIPGPDLYDGREVAAALRAMRQPGPKDWADPAQMMRSAAGNDHAGTIFPAAVQATEEMLRLIENPGDARAIAFGVLLDWWGGFEPEPGFERVDDGSGGTIGLTDAVAHRVTAATELLARVAADETDPSSAAARDLLRVVAAGWGTWVEDGEIQRRD